MRAMMVTQLGQPLEMMDLPSPTPKPGEVCVRVAACSINFGDTLMQTGTYQVKPDLPFSPGMEVSGTIIAVGAGVTQHQIGARVMAYHGWGGLAEEVCLPADICAPIPDEMTNVDAAAFPVAYGTSHVALDNRAQLQPGERLLVLGAAGGVGRTAVEIGKLMGAEVIAAARGSDKLNVARASGADHVIDTDTDDIRECVKALGGADVVYDPVGGDQFRAALRATNPNGRILPLGFASGDIPQIPANIILVKNITVIGLYWGGYAITHPHILRDSFETLIGWWADGKLKPHISHVLPLEQANEAIDHLRNRTATGKVVVTLD